MFGSNNRLAATDSPGRVSQFIIFKGSGAVSIQADHWPVTVYIQTESTATQLIGLNGRKLTAFVAARLSLVYYRMFDICFTVPLLFTGERQRRAACGGRPGALPLQPLICTWPLIVISKLRYGGMITLY